jgi:hypothetical protein
MPTLTIPTSFLQLTDHGLPWCYPAWQEASRVTHGLFPEDPSQLPKGWTVEDCADIKSLLSRYRALSSDEKKSEFLSEKHTNVLPGRKKWKQWTNNIWRSSGSQWKIIEVLTSANCHPYTRSREALKLIGDAKAKQEKILASGAQWIPPCLDDIAVALFGDECLDETGYLPEVHRNPTQSLAQRVWLALVRRIEGTLARLPALEKDACDAFNGEFHLAFPRSTSNASIVVLTRSQRHKNYEDFYFYRHTYRC